MVLPFSRPIGLSLSRSSVVTISALGSLFMLILLLHEMKMVDIKQSSSHVSPVIGSHMYGVERPAIEPTEKYAFVTFLNKPYTPLPSDDDDRYFVMARMMAFQILHNPDTKTQKGYPFIVVTSEGVEDSKIERLRMDGAIVIPVKRITSPWLHTKNSQWWDQLTKLRLFEITQFEKIAYFDTDTIIVTNIDEIFNDPAANVTQNLNDPAKAPADEGPQPSTYVFAGQAGQGSFKHTYPPAKGRNNLNAGCFVIMPSIEVFNYYLKVLSIEGRFPTKYMEQNLLSYVHRRDGNMPWTELSWTWNTNWAVYNDTLHGIATLHAKYWQTDHDLLLKEYVYDMKGRMYGYFLASTPTK